MLQTLFAGSQCTKFTESNKDSLCVSPCSATISWKSAFWNNHTAYTTFRSFLIASSTWRRISYNAARSFTSESYMTCSSSMTSISRVSRPASPIISSSVLWHLGTAAPIIGNQHDYFDRSSVLACVCLCILRQFASECSILCLKKPSVTEGICWGGWFSSIPSSFCSLSPGRDADPRVSLNNAITELGRLWIGY